MSKAKKPDLSLFFDILYTLKAIKAPYMIIGAFAGTIYGITRVTYDIDIIVDLDDAHVDALVEAYPLPRYYADPMQMRNSIRLGIMFNIIDTDYGDKADLVPITMNPRYHVAFENRVRQTVAPPGEQAFEVWCARPEDIIVGKLMAWVEGHSRKHQTDIYEMLIFHYMGFDPELCATFDEVYIDQQAVLLGKQADEFWQSIKKAARRQIDSMK